MKRPADILIPTPIEQMESRYRDWAVSPQRLKTQAMRIVALSDTIKYSNPASDEGRRLRENARRVLDRLYAEGDEPVYRQLKEEYGL